MDKEQKLTFAEAFQRLQEIYNYLNQNQDKVIDIDQLLKLQKEAEQLYKFCKKELLKAEEQND